MCHAGGQPGLPDRGDLPAGFERFLRELAERDDSGPSDSSQTGELTQQHQVSLAALDWLREVYAEIGVPEYWVVDLTEHRVVVHRRDAAGAYQPTEYTTGTLTTEQAPCLEIPAAELFPEQ